MKNNTQSRLIALTSGLAMSLVTAVALADRTYTTSTDFAEGVLVNLNFAPPNGDQLQINEVTSTFPILWIANAGEDTVSKINTDTNCEEARYESWFFGNHLGNAFLGPAPSRTAVDGDGNVYVANRHFDNKPASVMKILADGFIDRNNNGVADTSMNGDCASPTINRSDPAELIRLTDDDTDGILDPNELKDERVAWAVQVGPNNGLGRSLCIAPNGDIWLGLFNSQVYYQLDPNNGAVLSGPHANSLTNYGCLIDSDGTLYSANLEGRRLGRFNTNTQTQIDNPFHGIQRNYGIAIAEDAVYQARFDSNSYFRWAKPNGPFTSPAPVAVATAGISVDGNGDIVIGKNTIYKINPVTNTVVWSTANPVGFQDQRGVIVDSDQNVWVVNKNNNSVSKFDGVTGAFILTLPVGNQPYTYSDATGLSFVSAVDFGTWTIINDSGADGTDWDSIEWNNEPQGSEPPGSSIEVEAKAADDTGDFGVLPFTPVFNGVSPTGLNGRFIQVRATLTGAPDGTSPVLSDLSVFAVAVNDVCDLDGDGDVDRTDIKTIFDMRGDSVTPGAPGDADGDGVITVGDARACVLQCDRTNCQEPAFRGEPEPGKGASGKGK